MTDDIEQAWEDQRTHYVNELHKTRQYIKDAGLSFENITLSTKGGYTPVGEFSIRAGPDISITHAAHELSHGILHVEEGEGWRLGVYSYDLRVTEVQVLGTVCEEPRTGQATALESRVVGTQIRLMEVLGVPVDPIQFADKFSQTLHNFMPDWFHYAKDRQRIARMILHRYGQTSEQTIRDGWNRMVEYLGYLNTLEES